MNWSWAPNGVRIGWPYHGLWLGYWVLPFMGFIHLRQIGAIWPSVQPTALEKPNSTYSPNENVEPNNKNRQETALRGGCLFEVRRYQIDVKKIIKNTHFYKHIVNVQLTPQIPVLRKIIDSSVFKKSPLVKICENSWSLLKQVASTQNEIRFCEHFSKKC